MTTEPAGRRRLLKAVVGGAVAVAAVDVAVRLSGARDSDGDGSGPSGGLPALQLSASSSGVGSLEVLLGDDLLPAVGSRQWRSAHLPTTTHSMVGFTWAEGSPEPHVHVSSRRGGRWQPWRRLRALHDLPDPGSGEGNGLVGTDLAWIGDADGIQIRVTGNRPADLTLVLLHPAPLKGDATSVDERRLLDTPPLLRSSAAVAPAVPRPAIANRKAWGADESWRDGKPRYNDTIQQVHVHHTAGSNDYAVADVPALIRGIYRYHTRNLGWSDIAYNFLVDRFGTVWQGRAGGAARPVRGAHTLGFNATSTGVAVIGNLQVVSPTAETLASIVSLAAWKLDLYGRQPNGRVAVVSEGSDKFRNNRTVRLPVIDGHRDTNDTECPGQLLYDALPSIRYQTRKRIDQAHGAPAPVAAFTAPFTLGGVPLVGQTLVVSAGALAPTGATASYTWLRGGAPIAGAIGPTYLVVAEDAGSQLTVTVTAAAPGYQPAAVTLAAAGLVSGSPAVPAVAVRAVGKPGKAVVHVSVTTTAGPGYADGQVTVTVNKRSKPVTLVGGKAVARFVGFAPGQYAVQVAYAGSATAAAAQAGATVVVG